ncbi:MAG TPA: hypothetical protein VFC63_14180 [Blastocatellia bacterium]|nr:hypothetical protein [Blastocatellia bacterium]
MVSPQDSLFTAAIEAYKRKKEEAEATLAAAEDSRYLRESILLYNLVTQLKATSRFSCTYKPCLIANRQHPTLNVEGLVFCLAPRINDAPTAERELVLLIKCTSCNRSSYSPAIKDLESLGQIIQEFQPNAKCNRCKDLPPSFQIGQNKTSANPKTAAKIAAVEKNEPPSLLRPNFNDLAVEL